jgi:hypothetical protein
LPSYHLSAQVIKRSAGRSAVAAAAYRAGERLKDPRTGFIHDYSRRKGVVHAEIMAPRDAPEWMQDRQKLWGEIEKTVETRADAQTARELNIALPHELTDEQRLDLVRDFVDSQFVSQGMVADFAIHRPVRDHGDDPRNDHAHIMLSMRKAGRGGFHQRKTREWNSDKQLLAWRQAFADAQNRALGRAGFQERVDHRTLEEQREAAQQRGDRAQAIALDRQPEIHLGPRAFHAVKWGHRPTSRDRLTGPIRNRKGLRPGEWKLETHRTIERREFNDRARRVVKYTMIDHGTRFEENMRRLERNTERMAKAIDRLQQKAARFRLRRHYLIQKEFEAEQRRKSLEREREKKRRQWQRKRDQEDLYRAMFSRGVHFKRRRRLADGLIGQIDDVLRGLLGLREVQLGRRHGFQNLRQPARQRGRGRHRSRATYPKGPAI